MTDPLYYTDAMLQEFSATITAVAGAAEMSTTARNTPGPLVQLDRTCFYPEGGGQPGDRGTMGGITVTNTQKDEDGAILHRLEKPLPPGVGPGSSVECQLDWIHRYDYMQQHTGQHVLSAALYRVAAADTVSVHQGAEVVTIEVAQSALTEEQIADVEREAARIIADNVPVRTFLVEDQELPRYTLRRATTRTGRIRLVEIEGNDLVACGGVHLPRTGLLHAVKMVGLEAIRGHLRLAFKVGDRALYDYDSKHRVLTETAALLSSGTEQVAERVRSMQTEIQTLHRTVRLRAERLATLMIQPELGRESPAALVLENEEEDLFKALAEHASSNPARRLVLLNLRPGGTQWAIIAGEGYALSQSQIRQHLLEPLGAKGGGKAPLWRGIIPPEGTVAGAQVAGAQVAGAQAASSQASRFAETFLKLWDQTVK